MGVSIPPVSSMTSVQEKELRENWLLLQPAAEWGCWEEEHGYSWGYGGHVTWSGATTISLGRACNIAVYLQNWSPHIVLGDNTLEEAFSRENPKVGHFRIFGYHTYSHFLSKKMTKIDPMEEKGIFFGYSETSKDFHIYIHSLRKTIVWWDVGFEEDRAFQRSCDMEQGE